MNRCGIFPLLSAPHSLFSIWTNLKRSEKIPGAPTRWGEWIWLLGPPNFTTGVKYQFHQGFWPDQRSGNPNHLSLPFIIIIIIITIIMSTPVVPWLSYSPLDPKFAGSNPAGVNGFFECVKIPCMPSFGREVKPCVPCRRFTARKRTSSRN